MKIAIASPGRKIEEQVAHRAGRAPYYLLFAGRELQAVMENPFSQEPGGVGPRLAAWLAEKGVDMVVAGEFGFKMSDHLAANNIEAKQASGVTIKEFLEKHG